MDISTPVKITNTTYYSPIDSTFGFFIDGEYLYHCFNEDLSKIFLEDLARDLENKFKKEHPDHRVVIERPNSWKIVLSKCRDGIILAGKPTQIHTIEIKRSQKLLKSVEDN